MNKKIGYIAAWTSVALNAILFGIKYWAGSQAHSIAMIADAWHTLSDTLTSFIVIFGFWISAKPPDKNHPYGHGRAELIAAIVIATLLAVVAFEFIYQSIERLYNPITTNYSFIVLLIFALSIILKEAMAQFSYRVGKKLNSESLKADGWHHRSDAIITLIIVLGAIVGSNLWWLDSLMGIFVSAFILYSAYEILMSSSNAILGEKPDDVLIDDVEKMIDDIDNRITDVHNLKIHNYGDLKEITVHIRLPKNLSVEESHQITRNIEKVFFDDRNIVATVHVEPERE